LSIGGTVPQGTGHRPLLTWAKLSQLPFVRAHFYASGALVEKPETGALMPTIW
jgi:hypothetical protein